MAEREERRGGSSFGNGEGEGVGEMRRRSLEEEGECY